jgi:hypothetical protein
MGSENLGKTAMTAFVMGMVLILSNVPHLVAQNNNQQGEDESSVIQQGFAIAPVPLNLAGRNRSLVGLGSYLVNAIGDCNGCHTSGSPSSLFIYPYKAGGNPYFGQPAMLDPGVYLNGGAFFGMVGTPTGPFNYAGPAIITRNLTPNGAGVPEGGVSLAQFKQILRIGTDFDHIHPSCSPAQLQIINHPPNNITTVAQLEAAVNYCIPGGPIPGTNFNNQPDGNLLQIMPWPTFSHMTDHDIEAIYEYLSAIPCIDNTISQPPDGAPDELRNSCGPVKHEDSGIQKGSSRSLRSR